MSNKRIYEVAADYGKPVNEVLDLLKKHNLEKKNFSGADDSCGDSNRLFPTFHFFDLLFFCAIYTIFSG